MENSEELIKALNTFVDSLNTMNQRLDSIEKSIDTKIDEKLKEQSKDLKKHLSFVRDLDQTFSGGMKYNKDFKGYKTQAKIAMELHEAIGDSMTIITKNVIKKINAVEEGLNSKIDSLRTKIMK